MQQTLSLIHILLDTLETLENVGIPYVGAGRNLKEAEKIVYFIANGRKIAIVAATQIERFESFTKEAEENTPGVLKTLEMCIRDRSNTSLN